MIRRGDLYLVDGLRDGPRRQRVYAVVSREGFLAANHSTAICAPIYSNALGLDSEVLVDERVGLKHASVIRCDELTSVARARLTNYVGSLSPDRLTVLDRALAVAVGIEDLVDEV